MRENYPVLVQRLEKYKYLNLNENEKIDSIKKEFGKEFEVKNTFEKDLEM